MHAKHARFSLLRKTLNSSMPAFLALALISFVSDHAYASSTPPVHRLLTAVGWNSAKGKDYRLHAFKATDASGKVIAVPATLIDVFTGMNTWDSVDPSKVPPFTGTIPANLLDSVSLFYGSSFEWRDWIVVPRGWRLWSAGEGADGGAELVFGPPESDTSGWMALESVPVCVSCKWGLAMGLIPWAYDAFGKDIQKDLGVRFPPPYRIVPQPQALTHPNRCTAILRYQSKDLLPIRAVVLLDDRGEHWAGSLHLAVPSDQQALADYILSYYRKMNPVCGETR